MFRANIFNDIRNELLPGSTGGYPVRDLSVAEFSANWWARLFRTFFKKLDHAAAGAAHPPRGWRQPRRGDGRVTCLATGEQADAMSVLYLLTTGSRDEMVARSNPS